MTMKYEQLFEELKEKYTVAEIAASMMIPADLSEEEKAQSEAELNLYRREALARMTEQDRIISDVMRLRFQMEQYVKKEPFSFDKTFGKYLEEYIRIVKRSRREISQELSLHYTKLSRIINDKEEPNVELCYRLEKHAATLIRTELWWQLMIKKQAFLLEQDQQTKQTEQEKVSNQLTVS